MSDETTLTLKGKVYWKEDSHGFNEKGDYARHRCSECPKCGIPPFEGNPEAEPAFMRNAWAERSTAAANMTLTIEPYAAPEGGDGE